MAVEQAESNGPEHIFCDTSFVSLVELAAHRPEFIAHWSSETRERLDHAVLAVTTFVLGEVRSGRVRAKWAQPKIASAEKALSAYLFVPLDLDVLDAYVDIRARYFRQMGDNGMWIAASAKARGWPLVACDLHFCKLKSELELIYLPRDTNSAPECP